MRTLVVVEGVGDLVHHVVRVLEEAEDPVVELDAHVIPVLLQAERTEIQILQPVLAQLLCYARLGSKQSTRS